MIRSSCFDAIVNAQEEPTISEGDVIEIDDTDSLVDSDMIALQKAGLRLDTQLTAIENLLELSSKEDIHSSALTFVGCKVATEGMLSPEAALEALSDMIKEAAKSVIQWFKDKTTLIISWFKKGEARWAVLSKRMEMLSNKMGRMRFNRKKLDAATARVPKYDDTFAAINALLECTVAMDPAHKPSLRTNKLFIIEDILNDPDVVWNIVHVADRFLHPRTEFPEPEKLSALGYEPYKVRKMIEQMTGLIRSSFIVGQYQTRLVRDGEEGIRAAEAAMHAGDNKEKIQEATEKVKRLRKILAWKVANLSHFEKAVRALSNVVIQVATPIAASAEG